MLGTDVAVIRLGVTVEFIFFALGLTVRGDNVVGRMEGLALKTMELEEVCSTEEEVYRRGAAVVIPIFLLQDSQHSLLYPGIEQYRAETSI